MGLYNSDREEIQGMINKSIEEAQIKSRKLFSEETKQILSVLLSIIIIFGMLFGTIIYTSKQKTTRVKIQTFGEYNNSIDE